MAQDYKEFNKYSQQDKDSMRTSAAAQSNANENTLIGNTDEVESLLRTLIQKIETISTNTDAVESKLDLLIEHVDDLESGLDAANSSLTTIDSSVKDTSHEVTAQGQAIVQAIQGQ